MLQYAQTIQRRAATASREELDENPELQTYFILLLQNIGEAARNVSPSFKDAHPEIDWTKIIGMRHHLVHGYDQIDLNKVWTTATVDIPHLVTTLSNLLP